MKQILIQRKIYINFIFFFVWKQMFHSNNHLLFAENSFKQSLIIFYIMNFILTFFVLYLLCFILCYYCSVCIYLYGYVLYYFALCQLLYIISSLCIYYLILFISYQVITLHKDANNKRYTLTFSLLFFFPPQEGDITCYFIHWIQCP